MSGDKMDEPDYQLGAHDIDTSATLGSEEDVIEFDYEASAVFKRLADDIYQSAEAGIREPLTNSITAVRRANTRRDIDGVIKITVQDGDQVLLRLKDNGTGITKDIINEVLTVIGRSTARDDGKLSGQYGMGFLASYKLVGMGGGFLMCSNPRETDEGPYSGMFKPGAFEPDKNGELPQLLGEDEYGTAFEYYVKDGITVHTIRDWVEQHARWSPVPILFQVLDENGTVVEDDEFVAENIGQRYDDAPALTISNEYFEAACSPEAQGDVALISSPVDMGGTRTLNKNLPWNVDLRLRYENGVVIDGPHEGYVPVSEREYESKDEQNRERYIPKGDLVDEDMTLPEPTGTRERLRKEYDFIEHVNSLLTERYNSVIERTLDNLEPNTQSFSELDGMSKHIMKRILSNFCRDNKWEDEEEYTTQEVKDNLSNWFDYDSTTDDIAAFISALSTRLRVVSDPKKNGKEYRTEPAYKLQERDGHVYMTISTQSWKCDAIEHASNDNHVVKLEQSSQYELLEDQLKWTKVKEIKRKNVTDQLDISESKLEKEIGVTLSQSSTSTNEVDSRSITVHHGTDGRTTKKEKTEYLKKIFASSDPKRNNGDSALVLFEKTGEKNISEYYDLTQHDVRVANCSRKEVEYLTEPDNGIFTFDSYHDWVLNNTFQTSRGQLTTDQLLNTSTMVFFHPFEKSRQKRVFNQPSVRDSMESVLTDGFVSQDNIIYVPFDADWWDHIKNVDDGDDYKLLSGNVYLPRGKRVAIQNEFALYTKARTPDDWDQKNELSIIEQQFKTVSPEAVSVVETLIESTQTDSFSQLSSSENNKDSVKLPTLTTKHGSLSLEEAYEKSDQLVIHPIKGERISMFENDEILQAPVKTLGGMPSHKYRYDDIPQFEDSDDVLYGTVLNSEFSRLKDAIKPSQTVTLAKDVNNRDCSHPLRPQTVYLSLRLPNWVGTELFETLEAIHFGDRLRDLTDSIAHLHDAGKSPENLDSMDDVANRLNDVL